MAEKNKKSSKPKQTKKSKMSIEEQKNIQARNRVKDEIWAIVIIALGAFLIISLQTEAAGQFGIALKLLLKGCFGLVAYVLPYYMVLYGLLLFAKRANHINGKSVSLLVTIFLMLTLLNSGRYLGDDYSYTFSIPFIVDMFDQGTLLKSGGAFGMVIGFLLVKIIGIPGLYLLSTVAIAISIMLVINTPFSQFLDKMKAIREAKKLDREQKLEIINIDGPEIIDNQRVSENQGLKSKSKIDSVSVPVIEPNIKNNLHEPVVNHETIIKSESVAKNDNKNNFPIYTDKVRENQVKIIDYMKDDELFETAGTSSSGGFGLEEIPPVIPGMGLAGAGDIAREEILPEKDNDENTNFENNNEKIKNTLSPDKNTLNKNTASQDNNSALKSAEAETNHNIEINNDHIKNNVFNLPPVELLSNGPSNENFGEKEALKTKAAKLEQTLQDFNVNAKVVQVTKGPAVTRYEIQPNTGVKVNSIVRLADDIALNLEAKSIRIEAPIPGKAAVGIEVENERVNLVALREIIESSEFKTSKSKISFAVGKDIAGKAIVADLKSMPHMLIAGSTGSGKSVCINSIIISLLYKAKPEEVKFVLIDPKVVELGNYNGIPHLLIPVVTEPSKAAAALNWAVAEMTDRYKKFAEEGVRDLESFNNSVKKKGDDDRFLPQIVIIIDELADLMMAAPSQVEESICRLAQMARAAGMHLIVATQRPSVDIITGVIKANIPSRIAFAVSSQFDSRTILDMAGAEKLVGKGDMLFNPMGNAKPVRVQGTFISDSEVHKVIEFVKNQAPVAEYSNDVINSIERERTAAPDDDADELLKDAIETVVRAEQASVSMLQRRFRIGYNRAARLVDMMESRGIIGPADGSRPRRVLMTEDEFLGLSEEAGE